MENTTQNNFKSAKANSEWAYSQAQALRALFLYDSEKMVALNKVRVLSSISTLQDALEELKRYIERLEA